MALTRLKHIKKTTRSNLITFGIVIVFYLVVEALMAGGLTSSSFEGQLVPICAYVVLANWKQPLQAGPRALKRLSKWRY